MWWTLPWRRPGPSWRADPRAEAEIRTRRTDRGQEPTRLEARRLMSDTDPGVPEAIPATLRFLQERLGPDRLDRVWLFPPLRKGRRERGLVAVACFVPGEERRRLYTAPYGAERRGGELTVEPQLLEEGMASVDRLNRVMDGVAARAELDLGDPREIDLGGDPDAFRDLLEELEKAVPEVGEL